MSWYLLDVTGGCPYYLSMCVVLIHNKQVSKERGNNGEQDHHKWRDISGLSNYILGIRKVLHSLY